jgi:hypothetical protein
MAVRWFSTGTPVSSTNKTDCYDIAEILLKVALNIINLAQTVLQKRYGVMVFKTTSKTLENQAF